MYTLSDVKLMQAIHSVVKEHWEDRWDILYYVQRCQMAGFVNTEDMLRACAKRYILGKRKISPPGHRRKKLEARQRREAYAHLPPELLQAVTKGCLSAPAEQYRNGNEKAINSLVGMVMKEYKYDAAVVKQLLIERLKEK